MNSVPGGGVDGLRGLRGRLCEAPDLVLGLLVPDLRLEEEAHVLRVRVEVGVGGEGVVADALQAVRDLPAPRARVRRLAGLLQEAVGELQRQEALLVAGRLFGHGVTNSKSFLRWK